MSGKVLGPAISLVLVVGVVIGVVAVVQSPKPDANSTGELKTTTRAVTALCQDSDDPKLCHNVLSSANSSDPKDYIVTVVKTSMDSVIKAFNMSDKLTVEHGNTSQGMKMALDDCKDLLQSAMHELEASGVLIKESNISDVTDRSAELKNWLGAVVAYQQSCLDGFDTDGEKKVQEQLEAGSLDNVGKLTGLALDVVSGIAKVLQSMDLNLALKPASRRLLDVDQEGYPTWLTAADRKLMAGEPVIPHATVAQDGSGQFNTVLDAINSYPKNHQGRFIIYVKAGVYNEYILVDKKKLNLLIYGDGPTKTIITGRLNYAEGTKTMRTATFCKSTQ